MIKLLLVLFLLSLSSNVFADKRDYPDYDYEWYWIETIVYKKAHSWAHEQPTLITYPKKSEEVCLLQFRNFKKEGNYENGYDHMNREYLILRNVNT